MDVSHERVFSLLDDVCYDSRADGKGIMTDRFSGGLTVMWRVLLCGGWLAALSAGRGPPTRPHRDVVTTQGLVRGYRTPQPPHYVYLGLPYSRPPTRNNRFKAPEPSPGWDGIFEAIHRIKCRQPSGEGTENCLVVNVFSPEHADSHPVLVIVHGGDFESGWGSFTAPQHLIRHGFVIVTFNYRLGALGFLCLHTPGAPGNAGLKDQVAALYWVQRNIAKFGGDPDNVTIFGTGSGAAAVQLLLLSDLSSNFVHRAILESGSILSPEAMTINPVLVAFDAAVALGFNGTEEAEMETFYRELRLSQITGLPSVFKPCIESKYISNRLIESDPWESLKKGNFLSVPIMVMYTNIEAYTMVKENEEKFTILPSEFDSMLPSNLAFLSNDIKHRVAEMVKYVYFSEYLPDDQLFDKYLNYINDILTVYPVIKSSIMFAANGMTRVFVMRFSDEEISGKLIREIPNTGTAGVLNYFYYDESEDSSQVNKMISLWTNFMTINDPTPLTTSLIPLVWQPVSSDRESQDIGTTPCLLFGTTMRMTTPDSKQHLRLWDKVYTKFYESPEIYVTADEDLLTESDESS